MSVAGESGGSAKKKGKKNVEEAGDEEEETKSPVKAEPESGDELF